MPDFTDRDKVLPLVDAYAVYLTLQGDRAWTNKYWTMIQAQRDADFERIGPVLRAAQMALAVMPMDLPETRRLQEAISALREGGKP